MFGDQQDRLLLLSDDATGRRVCTIAHVGRRTEQRGVDLPFTETTTGPTLASEENVTPTTDRDGSLRVPHLGSSVLAARAQREEVPTERDDRGVWRYAGTNVEVPGARDVTLAEQVRPREVARSGESPEAVLLSLSEIVADARLNWALQAGTRLQGSGTQDDVFVVPWSVWQEHADEAVGAHLPERDARGVMRGVARVERELRLARHRQEVAARERLLMLLFASELGATRRATAALLGVSPTRVQQLIDEADEDTRATARELVEDARHILRREERDGPAPADTVASEFEVSAERYERALHVLRLCDLLVDEEGVVELTESGRKIARRLEATEERSRHG